MANKLPLTEPDISRFAEAVGRLLLRLPVVSGVAGHRWVQGTLRDYLRSTEPESEFVRDLITRPVPEVLLKWYPRLQSQGQSLFIWPDCHGAGGPGPQEIQEALKALSEVSETPADYSKEELDRVSSPKE